MSRQRGVFTFQSLAASAGLIALLLSAHAVAQETAAPAPAAVAAAPPSAAVAAAEQPATPAAPTATEAPVAPPALGEQLPPGETPVPLVATPPPPAEEPKVEAHVAPVPVTDPVLVAIRSLLSSKSTAEKADLDAMIAFYAQRRQGPVWITGGAFNADAQAVIGVLKSADDWGLESKAFRIPELAAGADAEAQAAAEVDLMTAALKYAHQASGGRVDPSTLSRFNDERGTFADPSRVLAELSASGKPAEALLSQNPRHEQFRRLQAALFRLRHSAEAKPAEPVAEPARPAPLSLANGPSLKPGAEHADVAAIRAFLAVKADAGKEAVYDEALVSAVKSFQKEHGLKASGVLSSSTRSALNSASGAGAKPKKAEGKRSKEDDIQLIALNMERWRWQPADMGSFHVENNIPEFVTRTFEDGKLLHQEKIIVGKPDTPTPVFAANMQFVIFHPEWGVPDSIKMKEILPYLRRKTSSGDFFGLGPEVSDTSVLTRHNLRVSYNGKPVDAAQIDWTKTDVRAYSFIQPSGGQNVLGVVKFRFPNRHDVYMHDTPQRELFNESVRAFSHGCMRTNNPQKFAEVILAHDRGWSADKVAGLIAASGGANEVKLDKPFPVHVMYLTARVEDDGTLKTFNDLYGHDAKLVAALSGKPVKLEDPAAFSAAEGFQGADAARVQVRAGKKGKPADNPDAGLGGLLTGLFGN